MSFAVIPTFRMVKIKEMRRRDRRAITTRGEFSASFPLLYSGETGVARELD
jgi:hypothetical protein